MAVAGGGDVGRGLGAAAGVDGGFDQVEEHPQGVRGIRGEGAGRADGGGVAEGGLEVVLAEGGEAADVGRVGADDPGAAGRGPGVHVPGGIRRPLGVTPSGRQQGSGEPAGPGQQVIAVRVAQLEPLVDQLLGLIPTAGVEGVLAEEEQRLDG